MLRGPPVYSPKNPPEDPLTDAISQGPQGLPGPPRLSKPTAPAAGSMGLACRDRQLQPLEAWASLAETDRSSGWEHQSHLLRPTASAAGTIGLSFRDRRLQ
ncbi:hypothetical protein PCANC_22359 [Puccinia coronata f. sp. avenae]|uniref:Uncharacterized protein n=1 Tax=Puccinia coronata f. sp. avenae TaxID=200324 RepID=A0A2N5U202_9BASI|nr:hypothetical protein PCANC_22359 [Puccinia coronata f. sp. avenae]